MAGLSIFQRARQQVASSATVSRPMDTSVEEPGGYQIELIEGA
jgi:hypothetical protein